MFGQLRSLPVIAAVASAIEISVSSAGGNASSPLAYGLMFEDINHSGDGGIYAELIQNRAFQGSVPFPSTIYPWEAIGGADLSLQNKPVPLSQALPTSINVGGGSGKIGISNPGWWGIDVQPQKYTGSFYSSGAYTGDFTLKLQSNISGDVFVSIDIPSKSEEGKWTEHTFELEPTVAAANINNTFSIEFDSGNALDFNLISLFPPTYNNRPNGLRPELMSALKALNPAFLRMPGGNNIEGDTYRQPWRWNETIGPLKDRPGRPGTWFYQNTDGLGLIEYFHWCEDLDVEPILAVWAGMFLGNDNGHILTPEALEPWVDDTLNELEFLLGPTTSQYGAFRESLGYPEPFHLKYVEIGNEDMLYANGPSTYTAYRFPMFYKAISAAYPDLIIISSTGDYTAVAGSGENATWTDYHTYTRPDTLITQFGQFDHASREYKTLIGEYAIVQENVLNAIEGVNWDLPKFKYPVWVGAVAEAIWSIGAERNGDAVVGMSYAPGFQNLNSYNWSPDLISFTANPAQTILSTSYKVIELFGNNLHNATVPATSTTGFGPAFWVAGTNGPSKYVFKTAIYNATETVPFNVTFEGVAAGTEAKLTVLSAPGGLSWNYLDGEDGNGTAVEVVSKKELVLSAGEGGVFLFELANYEVAVLTT